VSVTDVSARLAEIQARFSQVVPQKAATQTTGATFNDVLSSVTGSGTSSDTTGDAVVGSASKYLGVPYVWGGTDPSKGLDCSGLVQRAYKDLGIDLPRVAADQARAGTPVASLADAKPGDLVAFGSPVDHIGIYAGNGKMVVAPHTGDVVKVQDIAPRTPTAIRRIVGAVGNNTEARLIDRTPYMPVDRSNVASGGAYGDLFATSGAKYGVDPQLLSAVARAESGYNANSVSGAGAQGLMQLMPDTARSLGVDPTDPAQAVDGAARLLAGNLQRFGSTELAVAAYNAGGGAVARYGGIPPYAETQAYVRRVMSYLGGTSAS
jgi:hypothetical protein